MSRIQDILLLFSARYATIHPILLEIHFSGENIHAYSYNRLWKLLVDKQMTKTDVKKVCGYKHKYPCQNGQGQTRCN